MGAQSRASAALGIAFIVAAASALAPAGTGRVVVHYAPNHAVHRNPRGHPESPKRVRGIKRALDALDDSVALAWAAPALEARADAEAAVRRVHDAAHVSRVVAASERRGRTLLGPDTRAKRRTHEALLVSQTLWLDAVDGALDGGAGVLRFALSRPPGHHAGRSTADGFCFYNFGAAAAAYALDAKGMDWVAILDWDAHHGNGLAAYADEEPRVCYASVHQSPLWPGTGDDADDRGAHGNRLAAPVPRATAGPAYAEAFARCLAFCDDFAAKKGGRGVVLVAAGYDALKADPLCQCSLDPGDFAALGAALRDSPLAARADGLVLGLEGGYSGDVGAAVAASLAPWSSPAEGAAPRIAVSERIPLPGALPPRGAMVRRRVDGGAIVLATDADGKTHAISARLPVLGLPTVGFGDFDPNVKTVRCRATGTKFYVDSGDVRGPRRPRWSRLRRGILGILGPRETLATAAVVVDAAGAAALAGIPAPTPLARPLGSRRLRRLVLRGVACSRTFRENARAAPATIATMATPGEIRSACVLDGSGDELGSYLVRLADAATPATDFVIADLLHGGDGAAVRRSRKTGSARVAAGVAVYVEPAARGRRLGEVLFKEAMRACRAAGFDYMLFVERDTGSGKLVAWYEAMGFAQIPSDALPGLDRAMIGLLPEDGDFYDVALAPNVRVVR